MNYHKNMLIKWLTIHTVLISIYPQYVSTVIMGKVWSLKKNPQVTFEIPQREFLPTAYPRKPVLKYRTE